jgi:hypothetical protein
MRFTMTWSPFSRVPLELCVAGHGQTERALDLAAVHRLHQVGGNAAADGPLDELRLVMGW